MADSLDFWRGLGHVHSEMTTEKLLPASEAHEPFDPEPAQSLPSDETPSPLWLPLVGAALIVCAAVAWLLVGGEDAQAARPAASAAVAASAGAAAPPAAPTAEVRRKPAAPSTADPRRPPRARPAPAERRGAPRPVRPPQPPAATAAPK